MNHTTLSGIISSKVKVNHTKTNGNLCANFVVKEIIMFKKFEPGKPDRRIQYHNCSAYGAMVEYCQRMCKQGHKAMISGITTLSGHDEPTFHSYLKVNDIVVGEFVEGQEQYIDYTDPKGRD